jgi:broad specificity phosphatase PhoE
VARNDLYIVRHGATEWSEKGRHTGRTDIALTDAGRDQARAVATLLRGRAFASVFVSPMDRARETCEIAGCGANAEVDPDLCEWDYGDYEGLTTAQIRARVPEWTVWTGPVPNGESIDEVAARADRVIARSLAATGDTALFAHGHILRVLTARWCGLAPQEGRRFILETGTLNVLGWEHDYRGVRLWNDR